MLVFVHSLAKISAAPQHIDLSNRGHVPCIANDEFCIRNDEFCIKNDEFCIKKDEFLSPVLALLRVSRAK